MLGDRATSSSLTKRPVHAQDLLAARHVEHVALAKQLLGTLLAEDRRLSILLVTWKLIASAGSP
jgi:hypothetical protein